MKPLCEKWGIEGRKEAGREVPFPSKSPPEPGDREEALLLKRWVMFMGTTMAVAVVLPLVGVLCANKLEHKYASTSNKGKL